MTKRKRDSWNGSDVNIIVDKKPKRRRKQSDQDRDDSKPANTGTFAAGPVATKLVPPQSAIAAQVNAQSEALVAPPGLSKSQRKRWKRRQRKLLFESASAGALQPPHQNQGQNAAQNGTQASSDSRPVMEPCKNEVDCSFIRGFGVTHLMPRRAKEWHDAGSNGRPSILSNADSKTKPTADEDEHSVSQDPISSDEALELADSIESESDRWKAHIEIEAASASTSSEPSVSGNDAVEETSSGPQDNRATELDAVSNLRTQLPTAVTGRTGSNSLPPPPQNMSMRRLSFGSRATSIPSHSDNPDVASSFKRFSEYLHPDGSSSEDDESDDDEIQPSVKGIEQSSSKNVDELISHVAAAPEPESTGSNDIDITNPLEELKSRKEDDENEQDDEQDQLPRFSNSFHQPTSANGTSWPANVGIKRQFSFLGQEAGGIPSGSGAEQESEIHAHFDPFDDNIDSQELLRTVDEISSSVFGSTRPLPASKPAVSPDPKNEGQENGRLTCVSSDRRMTRSMAAPKMSQNHNIRNESGPGPNPLGLSDASKRLSASTKQVEEENPVDSEDLSESMSENIDLAIPAPVGEESDVAKSTSSLSELSRSLSPPANVAVVNPEVHETSEQDPVPEYDVIEPAVAEPEAEPVLRRKRKMTGRTSKHFTPQKKARKRSSTAEETQKFVGSQKDESSKDQMEDIDMAYTAPLQGEIETPSRRTRASSEIKTYEKSESIVENVEQTDDSPTAQDAEMVSLIEEEPPPAHSTRSSTKKRKQTGKRSAYFTPEKPKPPLDPTIIDRVDFYNTTAKSKRVPAGTSTAPVPPISSLRFGIIQEKLWQEPFWLLVAVTFLNKTTGRAAAPVFWALKEKYATPERLAEAEQEELREMIHHLGLQNQRSKRLIALARAWVERPPERGRRWVTKNYPNKGDHQQFRKVEEIGDADDCAGALEIGHLPGTGPYACDSWRIFCRDVLRGVAEDYNGKGGGEGFVPEWQKVVPLDKELRACLRWMWLREGWIWSCEDGGKRPATEEEMQKAVLGEMEIADPTERKFAALAAGIEVSPFKAEDKQVDGSGGEEGDVDDEMMGKSFMDEGEGKVDVEESPVDLREQVPKTPEPKADEDSESDNIVVTPIVSQAKKRTRRSTRVST